MTVLRQSGDKSQLYRQLALAGVLPIMMAVGPLIGYLIGNWLDGWLKTTPWLMVIFIAFGFVASGKEVYNIVRKLNKDL